MSNVALETPTLLSTTRAPPIAKPPRRPLPMHERVEEERGAGQGVGS